MSLYEPSVRSSSWSLSQRFSRPLTTLEGWRQVGDGVFTMNSSIRMFLTRNQFDPHEYREDGTVRTTTSDSRSARSSVPPVPSIPSIHSVESPEDNARETKEVQEVRRSMAMPTQSVDVRTGTEKSLENVDFRSGPRGDSYHTFPRKKKWLLVSIIAVVGLLPALTAYTYLPTLTEVANSLNHSLDAVTLTVTTYLVFQAVAPLFWGTVSDSFGRRPTYIASLFVYITASIVLSVTSRYPILLIFRAIQAAGVASTICLGCAVIQDISHEEERDNFMRVYQAVLDIGVVFAPVLGGVLSNFFDFRAIFIFLLSFGVATFLLVVLFLPETLRRIAGHGSVRLSGIYKPLAYSLRITSEPDYASAARHEDPFWRFYSRSFIEPLLLLGEKDILLNLLTSGLTFASWMMVTVSTTGLLQKGFELNELLLGLAFVPNALGAIVGTAAMRQVLRRDVTMAFSKYKAENTLPPSATLKMHDLPADFPLEHTRLRRLAWLRLLFTFNLCGYGFTLVYPKATMRLGFIAVPLFVQFMIAATAHAICTIHQTLVSDLWHPSAHASAAIGNLVNYLLAAFGVGIIQTMLDGIGAWSTFLALGLAVMTTVPLPIIHWYWGWEWRAEREAKWAIVERFAKA